MAYLNIDGKNIQSLDELKKNFVLSDVIERYKSGALADWLESHGHKCELERIRAIKTTDSFESLKELSNIFGADIEQAEQGDAVAQCNLGWMYENGHGVEKDEERAVEMYRKAAEQGYVKAQFNLGLMYSNGLGVEQSNECAVKWFHEAAEHGHIDAQYSLGCRYYYGLGVEQSYGCAANWFHKAAEQGNPFAVWDLGCMFQRGHGVSQDDDHAEELFRRAIELHNKAAEQGSVKSQLHLAKMYSQGKDVSRNYNLAIKWYRKAAEQGDINAKYELGHMYWRDIKRCNDIGDYTDYRSAIEWLREAEKGGYSEAGTDLKAIYNEQRHKRRKRMIYWAIQFAVVFGIAGFFLPLSAKKLAVIGGVVGVIACYLASTGFKMIFDERCYMRYDKIKSWALLSSVVFGIGGFFLPIGMIESFLIGGVVGAIAGYVDSKSIREKYFNEQRFEKMRSWAIWGAVAFAIFGIVADSFLPIGEIKMALIGGLVGGAAGYIKG